MLIYFLKEQGEKYQLLGFKLDYSVYLYDF